MSGSSHAGAQKFAAHVNPSFVRLLGAFGYGRVYERAQGTRIWDAEGREYLDFLGSFGASSLGHNPPELLERMRAMLSDDAPPLVHTGIGVHAAELGAAIAKLTAPLTRCLFATGGGEAVEAAMKLARAATKRKAILYCKGGCHGTTLGTLSIMGSGRLRDPFEPLVPQCFEVPFDDLPALERALVDAKPAAFVVEPIQAEAGVIVPKQDYLRAAHELCKKHGALLVLDEVQTGLGRTGTMFAYEQEGFVPDVLVLGKALGGGMVPVSAAVTTPEIHDRAYGRFDRFDLHGSTFSGWTLGCRVAIATLALIEEQGLAAAARARGEQLVERLRDAIGSHPFVKGVRGRGLLVAIELGPTKGSGLLGRLLPGVVDVLSKRVFGQWLALRLLERGVLAQPASQQWNVLKLSPPLTVTEEEIDRVVATIADVLAEYTELRPLLTDVGQRLGTQFLSGWSF